MKAILGAAIVLAAIALTGEARAQSAPYPYPYPVPAPSPAWSYDPYTSGLAPCPQHRPGDLGNCHNELPPSYGQPYYGRPS